MKIKCKSGAEGWQDKLQYVYDSLDEFAAFSETYGLHKRLGFPTPKSAWEANPTIQGSVIPSDYCVVR